MAYSHEDEKQIAKFWEEHQIYKFNPESKNKLFSVDTPPPTISGKMHIGHASSYTQEDIIVRYERMKGKNILFPFGTDDNGLPTERFVEKENNVKGSKMTREDFVSLCQKTLEEVRPKFIQGWKDIGISADFDLYYSTISNEVQKISQAAFIDLYNKGLAYRKESPMLWCPHCETAVAQAELEDANVPSVFYFIHFDLENGEKIKIATTRPELLSSCVCIFVNPSDERYKALVGKKVITPIFKDEVEIKADEKVDPEKGTGIVMCCTFGDTTDIEWYMEHNLALKTSLTKDGKINALGKDLEGMTISEARKTIVEKLRQEGRIVEEKPIEHLISVHERCGTPIEILSTKQWFIKVLENREAFIEKGREIKWQPEHFIYRFENWINNLKWDWCISRQRFFGIPFPVWYCKDCGKIILANKEELPINPLSSHPSCTCGSQNVVPEKDVMDTWATSSISPQIVEHISGQKLIPMDLRGQAHDIISTWLFYTTIRTNYIENRIPWKEITISGFVLDPKGNKMSKSKGNIIEPKDVIEKFGADALRYWVSSSGLGKDLKYDENELKAGKKLITKLANATNFVSENLSNKKPENLYPLDKYILIKLNKTIKEVDKLLKERNLSLAKTNLEKFFWNDFCDNYLELVKWRIYNEEGEKKDSAKYTLYTCLLSILKMFAPYIPFVTENIYQDHFKKFEQNESIHLSAFPECNEDLFKEEELEKQGDLMLAYLEKARKEKTEKGISQKSEIEEMEIKENLSLVIEDLIKTANIKKII